MMGEINPEAVELQTVKQERDKLIDEIVRDITDAKAELDTAMQNYNFADTDDLVDLYSYKIIAAQTKYNMLIKKARKNGLSHQQYLNDSVKAVQR